MAFLPISSDRISYTMWELNVELHPSILHVHHMNQLQKNIQKYSSACTFAQCEMKMDNFRFYPTKFFV